MAWAAWGSGVMAVLKVAVLVLLTRLLSPADFGVVSAALIVFVFALTFSQLGLGPALVQRPDLQARHISTAFFGSSLLGLLAGAVIWLAAPLIASFFHMEPLTRVVRVLAVEFPIIGLSIVAESQVQRSLRFRLLARTDVISYTLGYGLGITMAALGWGVWSLVAAHLTQTILRAAMLLWVEPPRLSPSPTWSSFAELMNYGAGQSAGRIGVFLANQADNMVVGRYLGAVALGLYSRAYQLMAVPTSLLGDVLDRVLFPTLSRVQDEPRRLASAYLQGTALIALITLPLGVTAALLAPELILVVFGTKWSALVAPFQVLVLGMLFRTSYRMSDSLSRATGRVYRRAWRQGVYAALVFLGAWIGQFWGVTEVAVGVLVALFINYLLMAQLSLSVGQITWTRFAQVQLPAVRLTLIVATTTLTVAWGFRHWGLPPLATLVAGTLAGLGFGLLAARSAPEWALGEHGVRMRQVLQTYIRSRLHPAPVEGSA
jgi:O-antigen/teichoic acid export membrane protein